MYFYLYEFLLEIDPRCIYVCKWSIESSLKLGFSLVICY